jgi:hypothetical protein
MEEDKINWGKAHRDELYRVHYLGKSIKSTRNKLGRINTELFEIAKKWNCTESGRKEETDPHKKKLQAMMFEVQCAFAHLDELEV